jgi:VanZ family protein
MAALVESRLALIIWVCLIYAFSSDSFSKDETSKTIVPILTFVFPTMSALQLDFWHVVVRKTAHISEYFILGVLAYRAFRVDQPDGIRMIIHAAIFVVLVALSDEFHQLFTLMRGSSLMDVGYDNLGGSIGLWLMSRTR